MSWFRDFFAPKEKEEELSDEGVSEAAARFHSSTKELGESADRLTTQAQVVLECLVAYMEETGLPTSSPGA